MVKTTVLDLKDGEDVKIRLCNKYGHYITTVTVKNRNIASMVYYNSRAVMVEDIA
jgi:hypothetical protein